MPFSIAYVSISISEAQRHRGTESVGDCVVAIYVEPALFTLFEVLNEIDESATTSTEEIAAEENFCAACAIRTRRSQCASAFRKPFPRRITMTNQPTNTSRPPGNGRTHIERLIVVHEATKHSPERMLKMITQTLKQWDHLAGVTDVLAVGTDPIQKGEATLRNGKQLLLRVFNANNNRAVLFDHEGVMYLYSMGPAATRNIAFDDRSNAFVELLCDVIEIYRPLHLNVASFNRLFHSSDLNSRLHAAIKTHVNVLNYGSDSMHLNSHSGTLLWDAAAMLTAMERERIAQICELI